jgi:membrane-associated phospholipid phosphatase
VVRRGHRFRAINATGLILAIIAFLMLAALVGPSHVYLGEHWPSDVVGAYLFAGV